MEFSDVELKAIRSALEYKVHLGDCVDRVRIYIEIIDKIDKLIEKSGD